MTIVGSMAALCSSSRSISSSSSAGSAARQATSHRARCSMQSRPAATASSTPHVPRCAVTGLPSRCVSSMPGGRHLHVETGVQLDGVRSRLYMLADRPPHRVGVGVGRAHARPVLLRAVLQVAAADYGRPAVVAFVVQPPLAEYPVEVVARVTYGRDAGCEKRRAHHRAVVGVRVDEAGQQGGARQVDPRQAFRKLGGGRNGLDAATVDHDGPAVGARVGYSIPDAVRDERVTLWSLRSGRWLCGHGCVAPGA